MLGLETAAGGLLNQRTCSGVIALTTPEIGGSVRLRSDGDGIPACSRPDPAAPSLCLHRTIWCAIERRARRTVLSNVQNSSEKESVSTKSRTRSKTRLSRALGIALTPKAARYLEKRPYAPGEHGRTKR